MARTTRIIWGKWDCTSCSTVGISAEPPPGESQPRCPTCGNPREQQGGEAAYLDNARTASGRVVDANVADTPEEVTIATAGADWTCGQCGGDNRAGQAQCQGCGSGRHDVEVPRVQPADLPPAKLPKHFGAYAAFGAAAAVMLASMAFTVYTWEYRAVVPGTVTKLSWQHTVDLQTYEPLVSGDWEAELIPSSAVMPVEGAGESGGVANIRDCAMRHHHDDRYECGTERVCEQRSRSVSDGETCHEVCNTVSNGNGSFTETCDDVCSPNSHTEHYEECRDETKYCSRPVEASWCTYDTWQWTVAGQVELHGENPAPGEELPWPDQDRGALQRTVRTGSYTVEYTIALPTGPTTRLESLRDEETLLALRLGQPVKATIDWDDDVVDVDRE